MFVAELRLTPGDRTALASRLRDLTTNIDAAITALYATGLARSTLTASPGNVPDALNTELAAVLTLADKTAEKLVSIIERLETVDKPLDKR